MKAQKLRAEFIAACERNGGKAPWGWIAAKGRETGTSKRMMHYMLRHTARDMRARTQTPKPSTRKRVIRTAPVRVAGWGLVP